MLKCNLLIFFFFSEMSGYLTEDGIQAPILLSDLSEDQDDIEADPDFILSSDEEDMPRQNRKNKLPVFSP